MNETILNYIQFIEIIYNVYRYKNSKYTLYKQVFFFYACVYFTTTFLTGLLTSSHGTGDTEDEVNRRGVTTSLVKS